MKNTIKSVKGTRDFYPEDMAIRTWLYTQMKKVSESFGYQEYEAPILETLDLYAAKSGEELVEKQSYVFNDRSGQRITLRPELTPSLARMVASKQNQLTYPLRWWSYGPFWRYERPQKGRTREFFQWNIDMIGDRTPQGDSEMIAIAATFLKQLGLTSEQAKIMVNNRTLMEAETLKIGITPEMRRPVFQLIDRIEKMSPDKWQEYAFEIGLSSEQLEQIKQMLDNQDLWKNSQELTQTFAYLDAYGLSEYIQYTPKVIRGLDYYTGTVFEAYDTAGDLRALFGGGRYDNLVSDVGGDPVSAVGFAAGDVVISILLQELGLLPEFSGSPAKVFIATFSEELQSNALSLASKLRNAGIDVHTYPGFTKLGKQFKYADKKGAEFVLIIGEEEAKNNQITVKDLKKGEQNFVSQDQIVTYLKEKI